MYILLQQVIIPVPLSRSNYLLVEVWLLSNKSSNFLCSSHLLLSQSKINNPLLSPDGSMICKITTGEDHVQESLPLPSIGLISVDIKRAELFLDNFDSCNFIKVCNIYQFFIYIYILLP